MRTRRLVAVAVSALALLAPLAPSGPASAVPSSVPRAAVPLPSSLKGVNLERVPTRSRVVALTFDGGGDAAGAKRILATLAAAGVPATFFLTGRWARAYPTMARRIASRYPVANHSESHPDLTRTDAAGVRRQVRVGAQSIASVIGRRPVQLFRFPYGAYRSSTVRVVNGLGYACIGWTVDTLGWMGTSGGISVRRIVDRVVKGAMRGEIVLMHLGSNPDDHSALDADALPRIIAALRARDYRFVTLPAVLHLPAR